MTDRAEKPEENPAIPTTHRPPPWQRLARGAVTVLVLVLVFGFVLPKLADYRTVLEYIQGIEPFEWMLLGVFAGWFLVAYVFVFMATLPTLRFREGLVVQTTATAINNSLPAGGAIALPISYSQFLSWGFTPGAVTAGLLTAGVWDQLARQALPVLAVAVIALMGEAVWWMWVVSIVGVVSVAIWVVVIGTVLRSESAAIGFGNWLNGVVNWVTRKLHRDPVDTVAATLRFRNNVLHVAEHRWKAITAATIANHASMAALFAVSLRAVGVSGEDVSLPWVVLAFALGRLLVMIPVSPGGLGLVDLGFIGLLTLGWGPGANADLLSAGVLLYRGLSYLPPIVVGLGSWVFWRANRSWRLDWQIARRGETT
jgi:uncharacterized membrane protein YbhN (UPF0104 family)